MASEGPLSPSTGANDSAFGTTAWTNPGNITVSDDSRAVASLPAGTTSQYLKATGFGFSIPSGATIDGIVVEVERHRSASGAFRDAQVCIVKGGTVGSTNKADTGANWPSSDAYASYGGSTDLWGETWTAEDINASTFGTVIACTVGATAQEGRVDHIRITVHYTTTTVLERSASFDAAVGIDTTPQRELQRSVSFGAGVGLAASGQSILERSVAFDAGVSLEASGGRLVDRSASFDARVDIETSGARVVIRSIAIGIAVDISTVGFALGLGLITTRTFAVGGTTISVRSSGTSARVLGVGTAEGSSQGATGGSARTFSVGDIDTDIKP